MPMLAVMIAVGGAFATRQVPVKADTYYKWGEDNPPQCMEEEECDTGFSNPCGHASYSENINGVCQEPVTLTRP